MTPASTDISKVTLDYKKWLLTVSPSPGSVPTGSYHSDRCFKISEWVAFTYGPCSLQSGVFVLILGLDESVHDLIKRRFFIPYSSMIFLDVFPIGFQS